MGDYEAGLVVRRAVLGDEYVERSLREADEFRAPFQQLVTEYCWGDIWMRDDLPRQTRSLINIAMLTALNRPDELRLHVRGRRPQRLHHRGDPGRAATSGHLLRPAGRSDGVQGRGRGARRADRGGVTDGAYRAGTRS